MSLNGKPLFNSNGFSSSHLAVDDLLSDGFLDSLVRDGKPKRLLDIMYGEPITVMKRQDQESASYNLAVHNEDLRATGGRVGFVAVFKNGSIVSWSPIVQEGETK